MVHVYNQIQTRFVSQSDIDPLSNDPNLYMSLLITEICGTLNQTLHKRMTFPLRHDLLQILILFLNTGFHRAFTTVWHADKGTLTLRDIWSCPILGVQVLNM